MFLFLFLSEALSKNCRTDFHEAWLKDGTWAKKEPIKCRRGCRDPFFPNLKHMNHLGNSHLVLFVFLFLKSTGKLDGFLGMNKLKCGERTSLDASDCGKFISWFVILSESLKGNAAAQ